MHIFRLSSPWTEVKDVQNCVAFSGTDISKLFVKDSYIPDLDYEQGKEK